jgi:hypothetical protein
MPKSGLPIPRALSPAKAPNHGAVTPFDSSRRSALLGGDGRPAHEPAALGMLSGYLAFACAAVDFWCASVDALWAFSEWP